MDTRSRSSILTPRLPVSRASSWSTNLAHTNVTGSRNAKRWQDVLELLDAGIDVFTTMNVQHVESLNDVIAQITRIQVRETVPDSVIGCGRFPRTHRHHPLRSWLKDFARGKVYVPEQASLAIEHFFQRGNLLALRELALRRTAQRVDADMLEYRELQGDAPNAPVGERVLVCVGPAPSSGRLIRAAARLAAGLRCPWVAVYAEPSTLSQVSEGDRERLEAHLRLAESLGATVARLTVGVNVSPKPFWSTLNGTTFRAHCHWQTHALATARPASWFTAE